ncbi:MAG TPA: hypothetical protein VGM63_14625 [Mucilaginibacter sp.]
MSSAFVKESEYRKLNEVDPSLDALLLYLRQENGGVKILETKSYYNPKHQRDVFEMSDGLTYALDDKCRWSIILD